MQEAEDIVNALFDDAQEATTDAVRAALRGDHLPKLDLDIRDGRVVGASFIRQDVQPVVTGSFPQNRPSKAVRQAFRRRNN